ncbi:homoserine dehydrogenase [Bengtsoniella intestinalis]|uniref:homoserine dehydrogenase n=1 Tax=Bengtsoniella intestinalis TaxID=3073143 RepID=UPI00391EFFB2
MNIAIMGFGVVGTGVAKVTEVNAKEIEKRLGFPVYVKTIVDVRTFEGQFADRVVADFAIVENDPEISLVVETIGGVGVAYAFTKRALAAGKHVVTANKQLVAEHGSELLALAKENGVQYLFEASVGGGIPILHPLVQCMGANQIEEVCGILNGTTNYILTSMVSDGVSFEDALAAAKAKGYAEADPTADVEGIDAGRKICILSNLSYGYQTRPEVVPMEGITKITLDDVRIAHDAGYAIKLVGRTVRLEDGDRTAYVAPHLVPHSHPLAHVEDVNNAVVVRGNATGDVMFYGKGAGEMPTASACVSDAMEALAGYGTQPTWSEETGGFQDPKVLKTQYYFRIDGSLSDAAQAFHQVSVLQEGAQTAFLTEEISGYEAEEGAKALNVLAQMRVLGASK